MSEIDYFAAGDALRARVMAFEAEQLKKPQVALKVVIHNAPGIHARELHIPAGMDVTGAIHKYANLNTLSQGEMLLIDGEVAVHVKAPFTVVSPPGTKRVARTLTDCVWTTYFSTEMTDPDEVVAHFTTNNEQEYLAHCELLKLKGN
jgi:hypothetical protein